MGGQNNWGYQSITATIVVAGPQEPQITSHGDGGRGSVILVQAGNCLLHMQDFRAANLYHRTWSEWEAPVYRLDLPKMRAVAGGRRGARPVIMVQARGGSDRGDETKVWMNEVNVLIIRIGQLHWAVYDRAAYDDLAAAFATVRDMAHIILPTKYGS